MEISPNSNALGVSSFDQTIKLFDKKCNFDGTSLSKLLLETPRIVYKVPPIDNEKLMTFFNNTKFYMKLADTLNLIEDEGNEKTFKILFNDDEYCFSTKPILLANLDGFKGLIESIISDRLILGTENDNFDISSIMKLPKIRNNVSAAIITVNTDSLVLLLDIKEYTDVVITDGSKTLELDENSNLNKFNPDEVAKDNFILELSFNVKAADAMNSTKPTKRFALLINCNKGEGDTLKEIAKDVEFSHQSIDLEKFKLLLDKLDGQSIYEIFENSPFQEGFSITCGKLLPLINSKKYNICTIVGLLNNKNVVDEIKTTQPYILNSLMGDSDSRVFDYIIKTLFGKYNFARFNKLKLFLNNKIYCDETINELIKNRNAFDEIDLIKKRKFELLFYNNKLDFNSIWKILKSRNSICKIKEMKMKKLSLVCWFLDAPMMLKVLTSCEALNGIICLHVEKTQILVCHDLHRNHNGLLMVLENRRSIYALNYMDPVHFILLFKRNDIFDLIEVEFLKGRGYDCIESIVQCFDSYREDVVPIVLIRDSDLLDFIVSLDTDKLKLLLRYYTIFQFNDAVPQTIKFLNDLNYVKLRILINDGTTPVWLLVNCYKFNKNAAALINSLDKQKFRFMVVYNYLKWFLKDEIILDAVVKLSIPKLEAMTKGYRFDLFIDFNIVDIVASFETDKFVRLLLMNENVSYTNGKPITLLQILENPDAVNLVKSMSIAKLTVLAEYKHCLKILHFSPNYQLGWDFIKSNSTENLRYAFKVVKWYELQNIIRCYDRNVWRNLNFALMLFKHGDIDKIECDFVRNNKAVYATVTEVFSGGLSIDQMLINSAVDIGGAIPNLKDMIILEMMDNPSLAEYSISNDGSDGNDGILRHP